MNEKTSIWKRELRLRRRRSAEGVDSQPGSTPETTGAVEAAASAPAPTVDLPSWLTDEPGASSPDHADREGRGSLWNGINQRFRQGLAETAPAASVPSDDRPAMSEPDSSDAVDSDANHEPTPPASPRSESSPQPVFETSSTGSLVEATGFEAPAQVLVAGEDEHGVDRKRSLRRRELHLGRRRKRHQQRADTLPVVEQTELEAEVVPGTDGAAVGGRTPLLKRELHLRRRRSAHATTPDRSTAEDDGSEGSEQHQPASAAPGAASALDEAVAPVASVADEDARSASESGYSPTAEDVESASLAASVPQQELDADAIPPVVDDDVDRWIAALTPASAESERRDVEDEFELGSDLESARSRREDEALVVSPSGTAEARTTSENSWGGSAADWYAGSRAAEDDGASRTSPSADISAETRTGTSPNSGDRDRIEGSPADVHSPASAARGLDSWDDAARPFTRPRSETPTAREKEDDPTAPVPFQSVSAGEPPSSPSASLGQNLPSTQAAARTGDDSAPSAVGDSAAWQAWAAARPASASPARGSEHASNVPADDPDLRATFAAPALPSVADDADHDADPVPPTGHVASGEESTAREGMDDSADDAPASALPMEAEVPSKPVRRIPAVPKPPLLKRQLNFPRLSTRSGDAEADVVGLRIGSTQLAAARVRTSGGRHELVQFALQPLESGIVVAGEVRDPQALAKALRSFFDAHNLPRKAVRLGIASNRIGVRVLEIPAAGDPALFENVVRFRAQEVLPIPLAEAALDQVVLEEIDSPQGPVRRILVAFAHRDLVNRYAEACKSARLKLVGIDFDAFALLRALDERHEEGAVPDRATVAVSIGHERTIFAVAEGTVCDYTRVLEWGGSSLNIRLADALSVPAAEAGWIKHGLALNTDATPLGLSPDQLEAGRRALKTELEVLARELVASLQFYQSRPGSLAIGEILLAGGGARLEGLEAELERLIGVPVRTADPRGRVELAKKVEWPSESGSLSIAVGLGMAA